MQVVLLKYSALFSSENAKLKYSSLSENWKDETHLEAVLFSKTAVCAGSLREVIKGPSFDATQSSFVFTTTFHCPSGRSFNAGSK
jgi:hypothetical protein